MINDILQWGDMKLNSGDKVITLKECMKGTKQLAKKHGIALPKGWKKFIKKKFKEVDVSEDGNIDATEWQRAKDHLEAELAKLQ